MASLEEIAQNINFVRQKIAAAAVAAGRGADSVCLIAVGKTFGADKIRAAAAAGAHDIGENYIQEGREKQSQLSDSPIRWHFIGRLQKNKTRDAARYFDWVHTADDAALARRLSAARRGMPPLDICIQVNIDREESKGGVLPENAAALACEICALPDLRLRGLMAIPRPRKNGEDRQSPFRALAKLQGEIAQKCGTKLDAISAGMSEDFAHAIAAGATHIRIGRAIFGSRTQAAKTADGAMAATAAAESAGREK